MRQRDFIYWVGRLHKLPLAFGQLLLPPVQQLFQHDEYCAELMESLRAVAAAALGEEAIAQNMQYFNKPPGVGQPTPPHQDGYYFMLDPCEAVTMWFALEDVDEENGCIRYLPGSHRNGMREHSRTKTLGFSQGIVGYPTALERESETPFPAKPGDLLVHDAMTIHRADGNRSMTRSRRALGFIYYSERAREDTQAHAAYQRRLTKEMQSQGKI